MSKLLIMVLLSSITLAQNNFIISFGDVTLGEKRMNIELNNFQFDHKNKLKGIKATIIRDSIQWVRTKDNLLTPRAMVEVKIKSKHSVHLRYLEKTIIPQGQILRTSRIFVSLYNPSPISIYVGNKKVEELNLLSRINLKHKEGHLIDYSCSKYKLKITGLDDQYLSAGCKKEILGNIGSETNKIIISLAMTNYKLATGHGSPFTIILSNSNPAILHVYDKNGAKKIVKVSMAFKKYAHRLKTAIGVGPYYLKSRLKREEKKSVISPALMLYGKWELTQASSFRFFNALVVNKSLFNNAGLYFAYDLASMFDHRFKLVPLLGAQVLTYKFNLNSPALNKIIYPQGFEAIFDHFLGIENFKLVYGMFLSTSSKEDYRNAWLRWGKKYFWEINYIHWSHEEKEISTWGLSIGIPTGSYF